LFFQFAFVIKITNIFTAHNKIPPGRESEQEAGDGAQGHGQVVAVPDPRRHPLPAHQLGAAQGLGTFNC